MHRLNVRRGAMAGLASSVVIAAGGSARSAAPLQEFAFYLGVTLSATAAAIGIAVNAERRAEAATAAGPAPGIVFGGFFARVAAYAIDMFTLGIVDVILVRALGGPGHGIVGIMLIAYFVGFWGARGQTLGMMMLGLHVVRSVDGDRIGWAHAVLRFVGLLVAFGCLWIGVIWVAFDGRKRGWQDMIASTVVVQYVA
ncbi:MAG: RDD family protein [Candidatus Limnocylindrales bacterium]